MTTTATRTPRWKHFVLFAAILVLLALVALLMPVFARTPSLAVCTGFDQIQNGMTEDQVSELLGGPRGVYDITRRDTTMSTAHGTGSGQGHFSWWYFPDGDIEVVFDQDGRVDGKKIKPLPPESLYEMVSRW